MKKKILSILLSLVLVFSFTACNTNFSFGEYKYTNPAKTESDWRDLETDSGMTVDGKLNESVYDGLNTLDFTSGYDDEVSIEVKAYLGTKGVYVGVSVKDDYIYYVGQRAVYNNTSVELHIAPVGARILSKNVVQLRYGVNGYSEQWIGVSSIDGYAYLRTFVPNMARIALTGEGAGINKTVEGQGFDLEVFMPYSSIGLTEKPEAIKVGPAYNHVRTQNISNPERKHADAPGMSYLDPGTFGIFDETGYNADASVVAQGYLLGNGSNSFAMTSGWEVDGDTAAAATNSETKVSSVGPAEQYIYVKDYASTKFYLETQVTFKQLFNNDGYPKFGITFRNDQNASIYFVDAHTGQTNRSVGALENYVDGNYVWGTAKNYTNNDIEYTGGKYVTMAVIRDGAQIYYLINGELAFRSENVRGFGASNATVAGIFAFNSGAEFKNIKFLDGGKSAESDLIDDMLQELLFEPQDLEIDGDLADWEDADINANNVRIVDKNENGKQLEVRAYMGTDGLYIAYDVYHERYVNNESDWWKNTNAEFFVNGSNQFFVVPVETGKTNVGNGVAIMNTEEVEDAANSGKYHTVVEICIPFRGIPGYTAGNDTIRVGFAFKTAGDTITKGHTDFSSGGNASDDWWFAAGHTPNNAAQQYFVMEDGIYESKPIAPSLAIDGALSDWTDTDVNANVSIVKDVSNDKGFTVRAFTDENGLYVAYEAYHNVYINNSVDWWRNTNAEIKILGDNQFYINAKGEKNLPAGGLAAMVTNPYSGDGVAYKTVVEFFIPIYSLEDLGYKNDLFVKAGFAFKTDGDLIFQGGDYPAANDNSDWWFAKGHAIGDAGKQFFVDETGISATYKDAPVSIDGNFSDWSALENFSAINASKIELYDTAGTDCGFTAYSFTAKEGIYVYYNATHHIDVTDRGAWHENTNIEVFVGGTHTWANAKESWNMDLKFITTGNNDDGYQTVVELFIPYFVYKAYNMEGVSVRFAFKVNSGDGRYDDITVTDAADWWVGGTTDSYWSTNLKTIGPDGVKA